MRIALALTACLVACGGQIADPDLSKVPCRRYPTSVRVNGSSVYECSLDQRFPASLVCRIGIDHLSWRYSTLADFVTEASVSNRFLRTSASASGGRASTGVSYEYDEQGRYARRVRSSSAGIPPTNPIDTTSFLTWDSRGRPLSGRIVRPTGEEELVTIAYDDVLRDVLWSNGERHRMDAQGNTLLEIWVFPTRTSSREFEFLQMAEICLPLTT